MLPHLDTAAGRPDPPLAEALAALDDGAIFYARAAETVADPALADLFARMAELKRALAQELNAELAGAGVPAQTGGSVFGALRRLYAQGLAALSEDRAATLVARLEEEEDRALAAFREAVLGAATDRESDLARRVYPQVEAMHAQMSRLKKTLP
jgi:uncharacterized protein (TIGR02284 family)